jgi:hypothetical protein
VFLFSLAVSHDTPYNRTLFLRILLVDKEGFDSLGVGWYAEILRKSQGWQIMQVTYCKLSWDCWPGPLVAFCVDPCIWLLGLLPASFSPLPHTG